MILENIRPMVRYPRLDYLDSFRAFAITMVVAIHTRAYVDLTDQADQIIKPIVSLIAVPFFFLCDGFLFVNARIRDQRFAYQTYMINSAKRLLIPWAMFSVFYLMIRWACETAGVLKQEFVVGQDPTSVLIDVYGSAIAPQMYFLLSLFLIRTMTVFSRFLATVPIAIVWIAFVVYSFLFQEVIASSLRNAIAIDLDPIRHALWGLQYYLLGAVLSRHHARIAGSAKALACAALGACCLTLALNGFERHLVILQYGSMLGAYFFFLTASSRKSWLSRMGQSSMGIYLLHAPVLVKGVSVIVRTFNAQPILSYIFVVAVTITAAYSITLLIRKVPNGTVIFGEFSKKL